MKQENNKKLAKEWFDIGDNELGFAKAGFEELEAFFTLRFVFNANRQ